MLCRSNYSCEQKAMLLKSHQLVPSPEGHIITLTPVQRLTVGKLAAKHGFTAAIRYFAKKYPMIVLKEATEHI